MGSQLHVQLPRAVAIASGASLHTTSDIGWTVPAGSILRAQQLLAEQGYLPVEWRPAAARVAHTPGAEVKAAVDPPAGSFAWRYPDTPHQLQALWSAGQENEITRGAVMKFENQHELTADGLVGPTVWHALLHDVIARKRLGEPYSYVYVRRAVPEVLTLWSAGAPCSRARRTRGSRAPKRHSGPIPCSSTSPKGR